MNPLVSVNISCFNRSQLLRECIESFIKQTYQSWELILIDDGIGLDIKNLDYGDGIRNMEARSKNIGGNLKWDSAPERGTAIRFIGQIRNPNLFNKIFHFS